MRDMCYALPRLSSRARNEATTFRLSRVTLVSCGRGHQGSRQNRTHTSAVAPAGVTVCVPCGEVSGCAVCAVHGQSIRRLGVSRK